MPCAFSRSRALVWQSMKIFVLTAMCCWTNTVMTKPARCAGMKRAPMGSSVFLGVSGAVEVQLCHRTAASPYPERP